MPFPASDGGAQVMHFTTLGLLLNGVKLRTLAINPSRRRIPFSEISDDYGRSVGLCMVNVDTEIRALNAFRNLFGKESYFVERFESVEFEKAIETILKQEQFDIIQLEHVYLCKFLPVFRRFSQAKIVLRPQNVEFQIWERFLNNQKNFLKRSWLRMTTARLKQFEIEVCAKLDAVFALTKEDADFFIQNSSGIPVHIIPMGYEFDKLRHYDYKRQEQSELVIYHLASMDWLPNVEAVEWFLKKVLPHLNHRQKSFKIAIAGRNMPEWVYEYNSEQIEVLGEILDPLDYQENKAIMIVPLWSGSGIRAKIIEGMALGKTIISTTIGAQGINYTHEENILIADTPEDFADAILKCADNELLRKRLGENARILGEREYHYKSTSRKMIDVYEKLMEHGGVS